MHSPLAINIRKNENIQGIVVDNEEVKLGTFADDLTAFVRNDQSLHLLLDITEEFGECSGLQIKYEKPEIFFLGNQTDLANVSAVEIGK